MDRNGFERSERSRAELGLRGVGAIRGAFSGKSTTIAITHRFKTIVDRDRVLVADAGRVAEFDAPHALLQRPRLLCGALVDELGPDAAAAMRYVRCAT